METFLYIVGSVVLWIFIGSVFVGVCKFLFNQFPAHHRHAVNTPFDVSYDNAAVTVWTVAWPLGICILFGWIVVSCMMNVPRRVAKILDSIVNFIPNRRAARKAREVARKLEAIDKADE